MCGRMIWVKPVKCGNVRKQLNGLWVMGYGVNDRDTMQPYTFDYRLTRPLSNKRSRRYLYTFEKVTGMFFWGKTFDLISSTAV